MCKVSPKTNMLTFTTAGICSCLQNCLRRCLQEDREDGGGRPQRREGHRVGSCMLYLCQTIVQREEGGVKGKATTYKKREENSVLRLTERKETGGTDKDIECGRWDGGAVLGWVEGGRDSGSFSKLKMMVEGD